MFDLSWYSNLNQPPLTPPYWVFAPVWTILYLSMLTSLLIYSAKPSFINKSWGYVLFFSQLGINLCWTPIFFYFHNLTLALVVLVILDTLVFMNIQEFYKVSKSAARCLIPYLIWILFATYLNLGINTLN